MPLVTKDREMAVSSGECRPGASHTGQRVASNYDNALENERFPILDLESSRRWGLPESFVFLA